MVVSRKYAAHTFLVVAMQSAHHAAKESLVQYLQQLQRRGMHLHAGTAGHQERHCDHRCVMVARVLPVIKGEWDVRGAFYTTNNGMGKVKSLQK